MNEEVKAFFEGWRLYMIAIENNYMRQAEAIRWLRQRLGQRPEQSWRVLEVGCGDAHVLSQVAREVRIDSYLGIDLAEQGLEFARGNLAGMVGEARCVQGDMAEVMRGMHGEFDAVVAGHTLHHLSLEAKQRILADFQRVLVPGGLLVIYDLMPRPEDSREAFLGRALDYFDAHWGAYSGEQLGQIRQHVSKYDFPIAWAHWRALAAEVGFIPEEMEFLDEERIFGLMEFTAPAAG